MTGVGLDWSARCFVFRFRLAPLVIIGDEEAGQVGFWFCWAAVKERVRIFLGGEIGPGIRELDLGPDSVLGGDGWAEGLVGVV